MLYKIQEAERKLDIWQFGPALASTSSPTTALYPAAASLATTRAAAPVNASVPTVVGRDRLLVVFQRLGGEGLQHPPAQTSPLLGAWARPCVY